MNHLFSVTKSTSGKYWCFEAQMFHLNGCTLPSRVSSQSCSQSTDSICTVFPGFVVRWKIFDPPSPDQMYDDEDFWEVR